MTSRRDGRTRPGRLTPVIPAVKAFTALLARLTRFYGEVLARGWATPTLTQTGTG
jgi:hypothetical protein